MGFVNLPPSLQAIFSDLSNRILKLESARFSIPIVAVDPTVTKPGDIWINSTSNTLKVKDAAGVVKTVTWV